MLLLASPGSPHMNASIENIVYIEFTKKRVFKQLTLANVSSARHRSDVLISECHVTWTTVKVDRS